MTNAPDQPPTAAEAAVREAIAREGPITFARFMEIALFSASGGYYSSLRASRAADPAGRDYFTAPMAHPVFGYLLALQLAEVWRLLERPSPFWIVEPGCGDGLLARDVLTGLERLEPGCFAVTRYVVADRAAPHAGREVAFPGRAQRIVADGLPLRGVVGCVLSNELLDAFPVHRFQVTQNAFQEIYVTLRDGRLTDAPGAPSSEHLTHRLERLRCAAPGMAEGHRSEVCLALGGWVAEVARALERGVVLTLDYGDITPSLYGPERSSGTLQCYFRHTVSGNPYLRVGRQDITAHVDFGVLTGLGEHAGLTVLGYTTQGRFMRNLGADLFVHRMHRLSDTLPQSTIAANRMAMLELVRPESFGSFKVLAQAKGLSSASLSGFSQDNPVRERLTRLQPDLPVPLLTPDHAPLLAGKYPHLVPEPPENFTFP